MSIARSAHIDSARTPHLRSLVPPTSGMRRREPAGARIALSLFGVLALGLASITGAGPGHAAEADEAAAVSDEGNTVAWEPAAQQDGIEVYTRPVAGSGIREFKAVAEVDASLKTIGAILRDADRFKTWFPNTPESKLLRREGDVSYQYSVMATPWPISDRDNVLRSVTKIDRDAGIIQISVSAAPDAYPEQADRVRVRKANGSWLLEAINEGETRVTFTMHLEPGGGIPQWLINTRVVETPLEAITSLRKAVKDN